MAAVPGSRQRHPPRRTADSTDPLIGLLSFEIQEHWGLVQLQKHLLQEDLIENCLRDQGLLMQTMLANRELLFRRDAFLGPMGRGWRVLKERAAVFR